jgi:hypothetical protein
MTPKKCLAQRIRVAIAASGVSNRRLAQILGVAKHQLHQYKTGHTVPPSSRLVAISKATGARMEWLMTPEPVDMTGAAMLPTSTEPVECRSCGGEGWQECHSCGGMGHGRPEEGDCNACGGSGLGFECADCDGAGSVFVAPAEGTPTRPSKLREWAAQMDEDGEAGSAATLRWAADMLEME